MVKITHKPRMQTMFRPFLEPWFETSTMPFSRLMHPWFRFDLIEELERNWEDYNNYIQRFVSDLPSLRRMTFDISCDIADGGDKFVLTADMPGMEKDEVSINVVDNEIEISAGHKESAEEKKGDYLKKERSETKYYRRLSIPEEIVASKVTAKMANGVLTVELPKKTPTKIEEPISIKVQ